jgi:uncharacterized glyoxalase superfamily protein PhnB
MAADAPRIYPSLRYRDAKAAIEFLAAAFGFEVRVSYADDDGVVHHAELTYGPSILMMGTERDDKYGGRTGRGMTYVAVDDADAHCARAREAGAEIVAELHDTDYGSRDYTASDPEGNIWSFGTYRPAVGQQPLAA